MSKVFRPAPLGSAPMKTALAHLAALAAVGAAVLAHAAGARAASPAPWRDMAAPPAADASLAGAPAVSPNQTVALDLHGAGVRNLALPRGKSAVIELPVDARDVLVSDPATADVVLSSPRRIYVLGKKSGSTDAVFVDGMGHQILRLNIRVDQDVSAVAETLNRVLPGSSVHVEALNDSLILSGEVPNASDADKAVRIAASFVDKPEKVLNMLAVAGPEQVMLKVRIVEVNRQIVKQLGVNLNALVAHVGNSRFDLADAATYGINGSLLGGLTSGSYTYTNGAQTATGQAALQAFEQAGLVRTLAEPDLTTVSGEAANFLAGGEFPVPVGEDSTGRITVTFKQFGVGLGFTPVVLSAGRISLKISTEYSQLTNVGALTQQGSSSTSVGSSTPTTTPTTGGTTSGGGSTITTTPTVTIPGLSIRRAQTVVELPSGGSMMIAGLLESITGSDIAALPGLSQLPVLGALFRSRDYQQSETELVVIVTPYLVKPSRPDQLQTPADGLVIADDASTYLLGQLNKSMGTAAAPTTAGKTYKGPFGYVVQ
ncbi:type II and III secretion system protein family protein [Caulobacter sp. S45]|uniref:type II and III secretion system protein family protein n=1 Tax=Caulobacter sp. S45 TaxID=1641861 RepID=UPI0027380C7A|nr:type II and III secretion system protein family protein [Caulobacter sp. S45]